MNKTKKTLQHGISVIKDHVALIDNSPGVYQMLDAQDQTLYVGKAKALKKRVTSYTQANRLSNRLIRMVSLTARMEFIKTHTEAEALLLEANLIKKKKPIYNILLKDDKSFPYIFIEEDHDFPKIIKHRGAKKKKGEYFGPFASAGAVNHTLNLMQRIFMVRNCKDTDFENRTRPCLQYHIKRCTAPCVDYVSKQEYAQQIQDATDYLSGKSRKIIDRMGKDMEKASQNMEFERAAALRDRIKALNTIQNTQNINFEDIGDIDVIVGDVKSGRACVQIFFFRAGQSFGNHSYFPQISEDDDLASILSSVIAQFYRNKPVPQTIALNHAPYDNDLLAEALSQSAGHKVTFLKPQRGKFKNIIDWAEKNLQATLAQHLQTTMKEDQAKTNLAKLFDMDAAPKRIEVYDNSHISGENMIGAMIVAGESGFEKGQYRLFNIKSANKQDDFDMMREVMQRRFSRALKENAGPDTPTWPDLLLIDGGKGQLSAVTEILESLEIFNDLTVVAISKGPDRNAGREEFHMNGKPSFKLPEKDPTLFYLQRLRDEAHRFAIGAHRSKRKKSSTSSSLDDIAGVGPKRKKALLHHFGSAKAVAAAGLHDLQKVEGISVATAELIYDFYHNN